MKRLYLAALIALICFGRPCGASGVEVPLRIAYQPSPLYAPLFIAKTNGWVEEEIQKANLPPRTVQWVSFTAGPAINESFAAGQQDIGFLGDTPALIGKSVGIDTKIVGLSVKGPKGQAIIVKASSPYRTLHDLKGKKVAVMKGSFAQHLLALALEKEGMAFSDIEAINMPPADIPPAIVTGTVEAGVTWEPYLTRYESEGAVRVLADGTGLKEGVQPIVASEEAIEGKRAYVEAFLRAYARGADYVRAHPASAARQTAKDFNLPSDLLEKIFAKQTFAPDLTVEAEAEFKKTESYMRKIGLLKKGVDVGLWIDRSFFVAREGR